MSLSKRAKSLQTNPSPIMVGHEKCSESPYSFQNPKGYLNFGTAENHLLDELLLPKLNQTPLLKQEHIQYNCLYGIEEVRKSVCSFLTTYLNISNLNFENLVIQTGVSAICESLSFALFDEDDIIMIPAPYYTGFDHDFTKRFKCKFLKVQLNPEDNFVHNIDSFQKAYDQYPQKEKIKAVLITHPHNPTGEVLSRSFMQAICDFSLTNDLELISDEIYALSFHTNENHTSLYEIAKNQNVKAHLLYGMAKDFALGGLKVGFFYSEDQELLSSMKNLSYFHPVSTQTQLLVANILSDSKFINELKEFNNSKLQEIPLILESQLPQYKFLPTQAGLFTVLDLSDIVTSFEQEIALFNKFLDYIKINMTPGHALGLDRPGYFRVCFAQPKEVILEFIVRMRLFYDNELQPSR